jgi:outer membrane protein TolC
MTVLRAVGRWLAGLVAVGLCGGLGLGLAQQPPDRAAPGDRGDQARGGKRELYGPPPPPPASILGKQVMPIDLPCALRLANVANPEIVLARRRVLEAEALRQFATLQFLPNVNLGTNYHLHRGPLQQSSGNILRVNSDSLYGGFGANAIAAGTPGIPGLQLTGNLSEVIYGALVARQVVREREFESLAARNEMLLRAAVAYVDLVQAWGRRAIALKTREETAEVARVTGDFANIGQGRPADADRARSELAQRDEEILAAENEVLIASARLAQLLNLDPSVRLFAIDGWVVPTPIVPEPIPLCELIARAVLQRPELEALRAVIQQTFLALQGARVLPFSPSYIIGFSAGRFGGGSNLVAQPGGFVTGTAIFGEPRFDSFGGRTDFDVVLWWTLRNLGVGNVALIRAARARNNIGNLQYVAELNRVRMQVAQAYALVHARYGQIGIAEAAVETSTRGFEEDLRRTRQALGLPIEVLDNLRLLARARYDLLQAISGYNRGQFELVVALGVPPPKTFARAVPDSLVPVPAPAPDDVVVPAPCPPEGGGACPAPHL